MKLAEKLYKNVVDARQKDAAWKELLVTAPSKGLADWNKVAAQNQEALSRSNAFEAKFFGPSQRSEGLLGDAQARLREGGRKEDRPRAAHQLQDRARSPEASPGRIEPF